MNSSTGNSGHDSISIIAGTSISYLNVSNFAGFNFIGIVSDTYAFAVYSQRATGNYTDSVTGSAYLHGETLSINITKQDGTTYFAVCTPN